MAELRNFESQPQIAGLIAPLKIVVPSLALPWAWKMLKRWVVVPLAHELIDWMRPQIMQLIIYIIDMIDKVRERDIQVMADEWLDHLKEEVKGL